MHDYTSMALLALLAGACLIIPSVQARPASLTEDSGEDDSTDELAQRLVAAMPLLRDGDAEAWQLFGPVLVDMVYLMVETGEAASPVEVSGMQN